MALWLIMALFLHDICWIPIGIGYIMLYILCVYIHYIYTIYIYIVYIYTIYIYYIYIYSLFWGFNQPPRVTQVADCFGLVRRLSTTNINLFTIGRSPSEGDRWHCSFLRLTPLIARSPTELRYSFIAIPLFTKSCLKFSEPSSLASPSSDVNDNLLMKRLLYFRTPGLPGELQRPRSNTVHLAGGISGATLCGFNSQAGRGWIPMLDIACQFR